MKTDTSYSAARASLLSFCSKVGSDYTTLLSDHFRSVNFSVGSIPRPEIEMYSNATAFALDWAAYNLLRKYPGLPGSPKKVREAEALRRWTAAERSCFLANRRISFDVVTSSKLLTAPLGSGERGVTLARVILRAQEKIRKVLGPFNFQEVIRECKWSGGATVDKRRGTPFHQKMSEDISVTPRARVYLVRAIKRDIHWMSALVKQTCEGPATPLANCFKVVQHNRYVAVPKSAETERAICAEPTGNAFLQQGVGRYIRRRLKGVGIDLEDQSFNRWLASVAYTHGYSTLDLESASDTLCMALVQLLLPERWYLYLTALRCPFTNQGGRSIKLEKFSSMGNAFTFELETMIFWALSSSVVELEGFGDANGSVYGDDIIVPRETFDSVVQVLEWSGFHINKKKSFRDGNFFESCGGHYFKGCDVTPPQNTSVINSEAERIRAHNRMVRWGKRVNLPDFARAAIIPEWRPRKGAAMIPDTDDSDDGYLVPWRKLEGPWSYHYGYQCKVLVYVPWDRDVVDKWANTASLAYKLRRPSHKNASKKGANVDVGSGVWVYRQRFIHRHPPVRD